MVIILLTNTKTNFNRASFGKFRWKICARIQLLVSHEFVLFFFENGECLHWLRHRWQGHMPFPKHTKPIQNRNESKGSTIQWTQIGMHSQHLRTIFNTCYYTNNIRFSCHFPFVFIFIMTLCIYVFVISHRAHGFYGNITFYSTHILRKHEVRMHLNVVPYAHATAKPYEFWQWKYAFRILYDESVIECYLWFVHSLTQH